MNDALAADEFIGRRVVRGEAGGFSFGSWIAHANAAKAAPHGHTAAHFMFVTAGAFLTGAEGRDDLPVLIFNPAGTFHDDHFTSGGAFFSVTVPEEIDLGDFDLPRAPTRVATPPTLAAMWRLISKCWREDDDSIAIEGLCLELLGATAFEAPNERCAPAWLGKACNLLRDPGVAEPNMAAIANSVGVHPIHLARTFRKFFRCTPGEYLRAHRAHRAAALLVHTRLPASAIAGQCGYADQSHFIRSFQRYYGQSPETFRRTVR